MFIENSLFKTLYCIEYNVAKNNNYKKNYELFAPEHYLSSQSPIYVQNFIRVLKMCKVESSNV